MARPYTADFRVLIAYATRAGSTRELAEQIGQVLEQSGLAVDLQPAAVVADVAPYRAVILGSALYFQRLMPEAIQFLGAHAAQLSARPLALFSVGAEMRKGTAEARASAARWTQQSLREFPHIQLVSTEHFAGAVELRRLSFLWRTLVLITFGERGDWRDIAGARAWASALIPLLH